jgi:hypothetical protein
MILGPSAVQCMVPTLLPSEISSLQALPADLVGQTCTWSRSACSLYGVPIEINLCFLDEIAFLKISCFSSVLQMQGYGQLQLLAAPRHGTGGRLQQGSHAGSHDPSWQQWRPTIPIDKNSRCWNSECIIKFVFSCCSMCDVH